MGDLLRRAVAEGIGTFFLVLIGVGAVAVDASTGGEVGHVGIALAFAFVVLGMIHAIGHISGAHINPAVTVGFWASGRFPGRDVGAYVAAQSVGALLAAAVLAGILELPVAAGTTVPSLALGPAVALEFLLTFALMFVIMAVATDARVPRGFAGLAVGLTVGFGALMGGPLTGASMNPARSLGPAAAGGVWEAHWVYWLAPVLGAVAAAGAYAFVRKAGEEEVPGGPSDPLPDEAALGSPEGLPAGADG